MSVKRFEYQRRLVKDTIAAGGTVLNIGCNTDPAGLKALNPDKVFNADKNTYDYVINQYIKADFYFDITKMWPTVLGQHNLIIFGDVLEHIPFHEWYWVLNSARAFSQKICITVPQDNKLYDDSESGLRHITYVTKDFLQRELKEAGWRITDWVELDNIEDGNIMWWERYFFVTAERV